MADISRKQIRSRLINDMGFSDKKATIYLSLLELGEVPASEIARRASTKRTTVYNILPELIEDGLVQKYKSGKKTLYYVKDPKDLLRTFSDRQQNIEEMIPTLSSMQALITNVPKIKTYEGMEGLKQYYTDLLNDIEPGGELLTVIGADSVFDYLPFETIKQYTDKRVAKGIKHRVIATSSEELDKAIGTSKELNRETRVLPDMNHPLTEGRIYGNKVSFVTYKSNYLTVVIESEDLYNLQKAMFERVWETLK